ncbi:FAD-dependent oxidoreductase domain-containing protein 1-like isoform X1 [Macrosteles quadrilineatus]|uniref:FAD-dependent oxidoreductase domain-containing protein 1-like isoform X1 n=1 Tax=Macrosteles quadrilineatus TaxID=74068 RepID=UPI0023E10A9E|nr:FAD-dependent oxidoreductase domain-containing protein 1-like isoform X1 [Macrosteles quadrilineatus]
MSHLAIELSKMGRCFSLLLRNRAISKYKLKSRTTINSHLENRLVVNFYSSKPPDDEDNPIKRAFRVLKGDLKYTLDLVDGNLREEDLGRRNLIPNHCDVLIVGGGVIGSSIAYWLKKRALNGLSVIVLEKDPSVINFNASDNEYAHCSTVLSCGGVRQQFSLPENIEMSMFGADFLRNIKEYLGIEGQDAPDVQFTPQGYLFLATQKGAHILEENSKIQKSLGAKVELLSQKVLQKRFPWMNTEDVALGCHGLENEGWFDPWSLLMAFKKKALFLGADYLNAELESFDFKQEPFVFVDTAPVGEYVGLNKATVKLPSGEKKQIEFSQLIIASGYHSGQVGKLARMGEGSGYLELPIPVEPRKRYVYCFHCPDGPGLQAPFLIDPSGMYFRREGLGNNYICGRSPDAGKEPSCDNLDVDYNFFEEEVWPYLAQRVPAFENIKVKSAWAGFYDFNTFDENAFVGPHPSYNNVFIATGFSGHGLQQAPAIGRAMMELIVDGRFTTIDLTRMQFERIFHEEYLLETNIV